MLMKEKFREYPLFWMMKRGLISVAKCPKSWCRGITAQIARDSANKETENWICSRLVPIELWIDYIFFLSSLITINALDALCSLFVFLGVKPNHLSTSPKYLRNSKNIPIQSCYLFYTIGQSKSTYQN